jgi:hypothetical protein
MRTGGRALVIALLLSASGAAAQTMTPVLPPRFPVYVDSHGALLGPLAGGSLEAPQLVFKLNGSHVFALELKRLSRHGNAFGWRRTPVWYDGPACAGRAAVDADRVGPWVGRHVGVVEYATSVLLVSGPDPALQPFAAQSVRDADGLCKSGTVNATFIAVAPSGIDLDDRFAEPFWLEVRRIGPLSGAQPDAEAR